jgi:aldose 1-epimerase
MESRATEDARLFRGAVTMGDTPKPPVTMGDTPKPPVTMGDTSKPPVTMGDTPKPPVTMGDTPKPPVTMGDTPKPPVTMGDTPKPPARSRSAEDCELFTLENATGMIARLTSHGASLMSLIVPDRGGAPIDIVLGFDDPEEYRGHHPCFGATLGRVANRIAGGRFTLDGREYAVTPNDGAHTLHGGSLGFDKRAWEASSGEGAQGRWVSFSRTSLDGEEGFPGDLEVRVVYQLTPLDELVIEMTATTDRPTLVNLAHHAYWNLAGHASGDVLGQELQLFCDRYTPNDETHLPKGTIVPVLDTPYDFTKLRPIGRDLSRIPASGSSPPGYNENFVVNGRAGELRRVAVASAPTSGIVMEVLATEPGVHLYTANYLDGTLRGKGGARYGRHAAFCLETQKFPDAIHHPGWPSPILRPGEVYRHVMVHRLSAR